MVMERERRALSSALLVAMLGTYVAFLATLYGSEARDRYDEVPVITWLEEYHVATSKAYMLGLGILGWAAFLSSADVYYRFVDHPPLFVVASACLVVHATILPGRVRRLKLHAGCVNSCVFGDVLRAHVSEDRVPVEGDLSAAAAASLRWKCFGKD